MQKIKLFLASSNELQAERQQFELKIYRKSKAWFEQNVFLHLDVWEDLSAKMSATCSCLQSKTRKPAISAFFDRN